jgi:PleD family two-component response regulator
VPIIFLTQKDERSDRITGLQLGVDDYITKPFDIEELALRIQNVISRAERDRLTDPRTGLPAARLIQEQAARLLGQEDWALLDCRIEGFERALDVLGSAAGDEVLRSTAHLIGQVVDGLGTPDDFLGHDWAGRFTVTTNAIGAEAIADRLRTRFDDEVEGIQARAATLSPRAGPPEPPPRMFLAVGVLNASEGSFGSVEELMEAGARARRRDAYERTS